MREYYLSSDIGAVLIGNATFTFAVKTEDGNDGAVKAIVYWSDEEFENDKNREASHFVSTASGTFGIFDNDCADRHGKNSLDDAVIVLRGRYAIYNGHRRVAFVPWP